ncbi:MAG TPA: hypothetical protein VGL46_11965 [Pseudonocardiaceae bacterium]|jgi:hypothetical protein
MKNPAAVAQQIAYLAGGNHSHRYITRAVELIGYYHRVDPDFDSVRAELVKRYGLASKMVKPVFIEAAISKLNS